jgi:hypothetical protein
MVLNCLYVFCVCVLCILLLLLLLLLLTGERSVNLCCCCCCFSAAVDCVFPCCFSLARLFFSPFFLLARFVATRQCCFRSTDPFAALKTFCKPSPHTPSKKCRCVLGGVLFFFFCCCRCYCFAFLAVSIFVCFSFLGTCPHVRRSSFFLFLFTVNSLTYFVLRRRFAQRCVATSSKSMHTALIRRLGAIYLTSFRFLGSGKQSSRRKGLCCYSCDLSIGG